jgi:clan AA aspartic protease
MPAPESPEMGRVMTQLKITNAVDAEIAAQGRIQPSEVRVTVIEALVDTGATMMALPEEVVRALGVRVRGTRRMRDARGIVVELAWVGNLLIEILGREMMCDALVIPEGATPLIGQIQLEELDLLVDPGSRDVRVNPESPDMPLLDLMHVA